MHECENGCENECQNECENECEKPVTGQNQASAATSSATTLATGFVFAQPRHGYAAAIVVILSRNRFLPLAMVDSQYSILPRLATYVPCDAFLGPIGITVRRA
jgi:hypothetical protein